MRLFKLVLISIIVFFLVVCFLFALFPRDVMVSRVVRIPVSRVELNGVLSNLSDWPRWNHFLDGTDGANLKISATPNLPGSTIETGQLTVKLMSKGLDSIKTSWTNSRGRELSCIFLLTPAEEGSSYFQWKLIFHLRWYPWEKLGSMFYERQFGPVMEKSILDLRHFLEKNP